MKKFLWLSGWACGLGVGLTIGHHQPWPYSVALVGFGLFYAFLAYHASPVTRP